MLLPCHPKLRDSMRSRLSGSESKSNSISLALSCDLPTVEVAMLETCVFLFKSAGRDCRIHCIYGEERSEIRSKMYKNSPFIRSNQDHYAGMRLDTVH